MEWNEKCNFVVTENIWEKAPSLCPVDTDAGKVKQKPGGWVLFQRLAVREPVHGLKQTLCTLTLKMGDKLKKKMVALFCCGGYGLGPLIPFRGSITAISARLFWLIIFILLWNTSILIRLIIHEGSLNGLMSYKIMSIIWYVLHSDQISTNTTPMGDFWLMDYI